MKKSDVAKWLIDSISTYGDEEITTLKVTTSNDGYSCDILFKTEREKTVVHSLICPKNGQ